MTGFLAVALADEFFDETYLLEDVSGTHKSKDPSEASLRSCTHVLPHRRLGSGGLESAQHLLTLSPVTVGICIK
jgi:hypothetical protein